MISLDSIQTAILIITPKEGIGGAGCVVPRMTVDDCVVPNLQSLQFNLK